MGIWELDLHHDSHECYNTFLFTTRRPAPEYEQQYRSGVFGRGTIEVRAVYLKASTSWETFTLENVRHTQAAPQENNHRIGIRGLPFGANAHLLRPMTIGDAGDGFMSISRDSGCAVGRINQGSRKIWALRTYYIHNAIQWTNATTADESGRAGHVDSGSKTDSCKRQQEDDGAEVSICKDS